MKCTVFTLAKYTDEQRGPKFRRFMYKANILPVYTMHSPVTLIEIPIKIGIFKGP